MGQQEEIDLTGAESFRLLDLKAEAVTEIKNKVQALMDNSKEFFSPGAKPAAARDH